MEERLWPCGWDIANQMILISLRKRICFLFQIYLIELDLRSRLP